jgi:Tol biopolymer transport system component
MRCDSKINSSFSHSEKFSSPNDSTIVFITMGDNLGWHVAVTYDYNKVFNLSAGMFEINASWSPDKKWLVYNCIIPGAENNLQLWKMQFDGNRKKGIILPPFNCGAAKISPEGNKIAFSSEVEDLYQVLICDTAGHNIQQVTNKNMIPSLGCVWCDLPTWSPDGENILFTYGPSDVDSKSSLRFSLASINLDTKDLVYYAAFDTMYPHHAKWSPVRDEIVFVGKGYPGEQIYRSRLDGTELTKLTDAFIAGFPDWSSDGEYIVYDQKENSADDNTSIWIIDRFGTNKRKLMSIEGHDCTQPVW